VKTAMKTISSIGLLLASLGAQGLFAADYVIDGSGAGMHTAVNFRASHMGISSLWGRFNDISGTFSYDAGNIAASTISVKINPASIDTNHAARDEHLRSADYMDVSKFPEAGFTSTMIHDLGQGKMHVTGNFTLHGVTKEISFEAVRSGEGETPFGDYRVGFDAETTINTADYGINAGELTLMLAIEGIRQ
jgi:polyisoprenoid-binding protein YceI